MLILLGINHMFQTAKTGLMDEVKDIERLWRLQQCNWSKIGLPVVSADRIRNYKLSKRKQNKIA